MRLALPLACALLVTTPVHAQEPPAEPAPPTAAAAPEATPPADDHEPRYAPLLDPNAGRRKALFDVAFMALVDGNLPLAERTFAEAAMLQGDPAQTAVAYTFAERVRALRARRRAQLEESLRNQAHSDDGGHAERTTFLGTTTLLGLGLYGWSLPYALGVDPGQTTKSFVGLYMITASASFIAPYLLIGDEPMTPGQANLAFYGSTRGIWAGVLTGALFVGDLGPHTRSRGWSASMLAGSVAGLVGGYQVAKHTDLTAGEARTIAAMGDFGLGLGFATGFLLHLDGPEAVACPSFPAGIQGAPCGFDEHADSHARQMAASGLMGMALGLGGGAILAHHRDNTWGDGEVLRASAALGVWTGLGVAAATNMNLDLDSRPFILALMAGGGLGLVLGDGLTRHTDFSVGQSLLIDLSTASGALLAAGTTYLVSRSDSGRPYLAASALGAGLGFGLSYWRFHDVRQPGLARAGLDVTLLPLVGDRGERGLSLGGRL